MRFDPAEHPHRRFNPLSGEWVLVSPHRAKRPWQGQVEDGPAEQRPRYDPGCYLCPGNVRAAGVRNPPYRGTYVFDNDFAALLPDGPGDGVARSGAGPGRGDGVGADDLLIAEPETGVCRVVCFSPRHDLTLAEMDLAGVRAVVDLWTNQYRGLGALDGINHVQIFENKGAMMGCSNPHPHGQIWAQRSIPEQPAKALARQRGHLDRRGATLLGDYLKLELDRGERVVCANDAFVALVPYWATWPFETLILCRRRAASLDALDDGEKTALADIIRRMSVRYDNLFHISFPYSAGLRQAPTDGDAHPEWDLHMHFYPPLLRSATVRKFMVGYEMLGEPQRDLTPEQCAATLRALSETHYKQASA